MKRFFYFLLALTMVSNNVMAFDYEPEEGLTYMGIFGMNVSKLQNHHYSSKVGAAMGLRLDYMLPHAHGAYITSGLDWTMKGGKTSVVALVGNTEYDGTLKYSMHYFEIPIHAGFRYNFNENIGVYAEFGPYFSVGVGGKHKANIDGDGEAVREEEEANTHKAFKNYGYPQETFQRWDAGLGFRVGAEYNEHYNLIIGCDWGLTDIYRNSYRDAYYDAHKTPDGKSISLPKVKNFNLSVTLGYRF
ncbi:MAG: outer membrane beta-barrel protein [Bacteroidaceae bacterium]|nr:outer membrane beta-barrel protein [Bacteroidaceae bacterium]